MKKIAITCFLIALLAVCPACTNQVAAFTDTQKNVSIELVRSFFENAELRDFNVISDIKVDGKNCIQIEVNGTYNGGKYLIDTFAVDSASSDVYYREKDGSFTLLQDTPWYAYSISPDESMAIECLDIADGGRGPSGVQVLGLTRIIDLENENIIWSDSGAMYEKYLWSQGNIFAARQYSGRQWTATDIIDTRTGETLCLPRCSDIAEQNGLPGLAPEGLTGLEINKWLSDTEILIDFFWDAPNGHRVKGILTYNVESNEIHIEASEEVSIG